MQEVNLPFTFRCGEVLAEPTGGKLELRDGVHIRRKAE
jgi:ribosomal protein S27E